MTTDPRTRCEILDLGRVGYRRAWEIQRRIVDELVRGERADGVLVLCEHDEVVTVGRAGRRQADRHLRVSRDELKTAGIDLIETDRGGDVTWHGPGQLVGYPVLPLAQYRRDVEWYVRALEEVVLHSLDGGFGIQGHRVAGRSGIWVRGARGDEKVAALGVGFRRWVTFHGFSLNVSVDLSRYDRIVPCGIRDAGVTSIDRLIGRTPTLEQARHAVASSFEEVFETRLETLAASFER